MFQGDVRPEPRQRDGERLGCGAYLSALERTRIGPFLLADAVTLEELGAYGTMLAAKPT